MKMLENQQLLPKEDEKFAQQCAADMMSFESEISQSIVKSCALVTGKRKRKMTMATIQWKPTIQKKPIEKKQQDCQHQS